MFRKKSVILLVVVLSLVLALPAFAAAPEQGTVYEGVSVPGIALGDSRMQVDASVGPASNCVSNNNPPTMESCRYDVAGGGWVSVRYQGPNGGEATGSPDDVAASIRWSEDVDGWVTSAGISIPMIKFDRQLAIDTYPNAVLFYDEFGNVVRLTDYDQGISISWDAVYIFFSASMTIFAPYPYTPPAPPDYIRVSDIELSTTRRSVTADVIVVDDQGDPVEGAGVSGFWVYPLNRNNNSTLFFSDTTDAQGIASFSIGDNARPGEYRINIENVSKDGFVFDQDGSIRVATITKTK
jgi:hypothetical protein